MSMLWCHRTAKVMVASASAELDVDFQAVTVQYPFAGQPETRSVYVLTHLEATGRLMRPTDVIALADTLTGYAARLREVADELVIAQQQDRARLLRLTSKTQAGKDEPRADGAA